MLFFLFFSHRLEAVGSPRFGVRSGSVLEGCGGCCGEYHQFLLNSTVGGEGCKKVVPSQSESHGDHLTVG